MRVFIFESTRAVINGERAVRDAGIECRVIPVPRSVSPMCGMALELAVEYEQDVKQLFDEIRIKTDVFDRESLKL
jgi:hypothetical protein